MRSCRATRAGLAGGIILGAAGFGNAIGPLIGGGLTDSIGWRWIFFLNLPIAVFAMLITFHVVGNDQPDRAGQQIDYAGIAALSVGVLSLLLALDEGTDLRLDQPANPRPLRARRRWRWSSSRSSNGAPVATALVPARRARQPPVRRRLPRDAADLGDLLLGPSLSCRSSWRSSSASRRSAPAPACCR